jgi:hypothetical protein
MGVVQEEAEPRGRGAYPGVPGRLSQGFSGAGVHTGGEHATGQGSPYAGGKKFTRKMGTTQH